MPTDTDKFELVESMIGRDLDIEESTLIMGWIQSGMRVSEAYLRYQELCGLPRVV